MKVIINNFLIILMFSVFNSAFIIESIWIDNTNNKIVHISKINDMIYRINIFYIRKETVSVEAVSLSNQTINTKHYEQTTTKSNCNWTV